MTTDFDMNGPIAHSGGVGRGQSMGVPAPPHGELGKMSLNSDRGDGDRNNVCSYFVICCCIISFVLSMSVMIDNIHYL